LRWSISKIRLSDTRRAAELTLAREAQAEGSTTPIFEVLPKYITFFLKLSGLKYIALSLIKVFFRRLLWVKIYK
jgi:hypothetical protein